MVLKRSKNKIGYYSEWDSSCGIFVKGKSIIVKMFVWHMAEWFYFSNYAKKIGAVSFYTFSDENLQVPLHRFLMEKGGL